MQQRASTRILQNRVKKLMNFQPQVATPLANDVKTSVAATREETGLIPDVSGLIGEMAKPTRYWWWISTPHWTEGEKGYLFMPLDLLELQGCSPAVGVKFTEEQLRNEPYLNNATRPPKPKQNSLWTLQQSILRHLHEMLQICVVIGWMGTALG